MGDRAGGVPAGPILGCSLLFALGAVAMRGAGCTLNDIADRDYDAQVARTRLRPLPSGPVTVPQAVALPGCFSWRSAPPCCFSLNRTSILLGLAVLGLIGTYPFMKRITYWPQVFLGLNFNWGALIGWTAVTGEPRLPPLLLYLGGIFWTIGYDTIYAHQDKEDDLRIGVKSSALALGVAHPSVALRLLCRRAAAVGGGGHRRRARRRCSGRARRRRRLQLAWQAARVDTDDPADCLAKFRSNRASAG